MMFPTAELHQAQNIYGILAETLVTCLSFSSCDLLMAGQLSGLPLTAGAW